MGERKVLNKYFPPDFDPDNVPRRKMDRDQRHKVRLMAPFNMQCMKCGEWIYKGKKFNAGKEIAHGEDYLGIQKFRFFIRCPMCVSEIVFKTDPENTDYVIEVGAQRNFEPWKDKAKFELHEKNKRDNEEEDNPIKALENRTKDSKRMMEDMDELEDIFEAKNRHANLTMEQILKIKQDHDAEQLKKAKEAEDQEDDELVNKMFGKDNIRRLHDDDDDDDTRAVSKKRAKQAPPTAVLVSAAEEKKRLPPKGGGGGLLGALRSKKGLGEGVVVKVGGRPVDKPAKAKPVPVPAKATRPSGGLGGLAYSSSSDDSD